MREKRAPVTCQACGYAWTPKVDRPKECPDCKSRAWAPRPERPARPASTEMAPART